MGKRVTLALVCAVLVGACGVAAAPTGPDASDRPGDRATMGAWRTQYFFNPWGWANYLPPVYTYSLGNPFAPPPLAAGPWINPFLGTVNYSVGFPWAGGWPGAIPVL